MAYLLTLDAVKSAARAAYENGYLGFQRGEVYCLYKGLSGAPCAIGAALPDDLIETISENDDLNGLPINRLAEAGYIEFVNETERGRIARIQWAHDNIINGGLDFSRRDADPIKSFEELIYEEV